MKVLVVARCRNGRYAPFIEEQVQALERGGVECRMFPVNSNRYLPRLSTLKREIREFRPDIVHAHYGLCGLLANLQRKVPVVTTYHGSDINDARVRPLSRLAIRLSRYNILVSQQSMDLARPRRDSAALIPCGINLEDYPEIDKSKARDIMGLRTDGKYVLFSGSFDNAVKDAPLAKTVVGMFPGAELLELKGYTRQQVAALMYACDALLMTSRSEGSPQVVKEALACGCPIVSVDVGDVRERTDGIPGCYVASSRDAQELASLLGKALAFQGRTKGREVVAALNSEAVAGRIIEVYKRVLMA